jgi:hypothetical protein
MAVLLTLPALLALVAGEDDLLYIHIGKCGGTMVLPFVRCPAFQRFSLLSPPFSRAPSWECPLASGPKFPLVSPIVRCPTFLSAFFPARLTGSLLGLRSTLSPLHLAPFFPLVL